jgi:hypothetical protein
VQFQHISGQAVKNWTGGTAGSLALRHAGHLHKHAFCCHCQDSTQRKGVLSCTCNLRPQIYNHRQTAHLYRCAPKQLHWMVSPAVACCTGTAGCAACCRDSVCCRSADDVVCCMSAVGVLRCGGSDVFPAAALLPSGAMAAEAAAAEAACFGLLPPRCT